MQNTKTTVQITKQKKPKHILQNITKIIQIRNKTNKHKIFERLQLEGPPDLKYLVFLVI